MAWVFMYKKLFKKLFFEILNGKHMTCFINKLIRWISYHLSWKWTEQVLRLFKRRFNHYPWKRVQHGFVKITPMESALDFSESNTQYVKHDVYTIFPWIILNIGFTWIGALDAREVGIAKFAKYSKNFQTNFYSDLLRTFSFELGLLRNTRMPLNCLCKPPYNFWIYFKSILANFSEYYADLLSVMFAATAG